ncbi:UNVERIFIED_CONTAM: hypothetical protein PYX00_002946 [Menopon gallinae]|uniref:WD repeat-containing protein 36 n=1 Tax=Menopon gallinae TaxID=328185 RepID=A0AAW2HYR3_9NEOP
MSSSSKIFVRHKALGYVSNHVPVVTRYINRRRENILVTCVGKALHTYGSSHFKLLSVSDLHPEDITCTAGDTYLVYSAAGKTIYAWRRGTELKHKYEGHKYTVKLLLPFGNHLVSVDESSHLKVWDIKNESVHSELDFQNELFRISAIMHPHTYENKILLGSDQGYLQLWNLMTSKMIYSFQGWDSGVTVLEQSPALDIVGIGLKNGRIILHNLKYDEVVMEFQQDWGIVTSLTFRVDGPPILITGSTYGHLVFWNLDEKKVFAQIKHAHQKEVTGLKCFPSEPLMVSSSPDNSLKLWIFDMPDGGARLLRLREGHSLPPTYVRFYGSNGHNLLVSGGDSTLRLFNTVTEIFNTSFGKATYRSVKAKKKHNYSTDPLKMPPIVAFSAEVTREKEWDNIAAIHSGIPKVTTWSYNKKKFSEKILLNKRFITFADRKQVKLKGVATSVFVTHCGNFVIAGYSTGHCDKFNIQSHLHRGSYGNGSAHDGAVRGVAVDVLNLMLTTGGSDGFIKWWNFKSTKNSKELCKIKLEAGVSFFNYHSESALLAVALDNFTIVLIDNEGRNVVRTFTGHSGKLNDITFSPDSKWLVSAGMDCMILTWDLPSGCLVDQFKVDAPCTSLSFSPTGEYLATTHVQYLGVSLWSNRTLYNHVALKPVKLGDDAPVMALPSTMVQPAEAVSEVEEEEDEVSELSDQIRDLVTLSTLDSSRWKNLLNLDIIKQRNKPKEPLNVPQTAPFFLPTIPSTDIKFDFSDLKDRQVEKVSLTHLENLTSFGKYLKGVETDEDFINAFEKLKKMGPSAIDFEINSLTSGLENSETLLKQFLKMVKIVLDSKVDFELVQSYLGLFLKVHGKEIIENNELLNSLEQLQESQLDSWQKVEENLFYNLSVIQALKM